jgi:DNA processing protein
MRPNRPSLVVPLLPEELRGSRLPPRLSDLAQPPECLYLRGVLPPGPAVAIVGTRKPSAEAERFAEALAADLGSVGVAVLSGGATGIDTAAHRGALRAGAPTVVVAPSGFGRPYPEGNAGLYRSVIERGGAFVSLVPDDRVASNSAFFARNACLVALSHALVLIEAPFRSGARNAVKWARTLGRSLLVVPHPPWNPKGSGSLIELRAGATLCVRARDVLDELERVLYHPLPSPADADDAPTIQIQLPFGGTLAPSGEVAIVLAALKDGATTLDGIAERTGLAAGVVQKHVLTLTLEGVLAPDPSGCLLRSPDHRTVSVVKSRK